MSALFTAPPKVDWFRVFVDLEKAGLCLAEVARRMNIPRTTLEHWRNGGEPKHSGGDALLAYYREIFERPEPRIKSHA
jgi:hypothetical protein